MKFLTLAVALAAPALAVKKIATTPASVGLRMSSKVTGATASMLFTSAGGLSIAASKCVDRSSFCGRYARPACPPSSAAVASRIELRGVDGPAHYIVLRDDGTLSFDAGSGCVNPVSMWNAVPDHGAVLKGDTSSAYVTTSSSGIELMSASGFTVNGDTIEPRCSCTNGNAHTDSCNAHEDHHCSSCDVGFYLTGKTCTAFTVCKAGEHQTTAPVQTT